jgi:hypothetical protein
MGGEPSQAHVLSHVGHLDTGQPEGRAGECLRATEFAAGLRKCPALEGPAKHAGGEADVVGQHRPVAELHVNGMNIAAASVPGQQSSKFTLPQ